MRFGHCGQIIESQQRGGCGKPGRGMVDGVRLHTTLRSVLKWGEYDVVHVVREEEVHAGCVEASGRTPREDQYNSEALPVLCFHGLAITMAIMSPPIPPSHQPPWNNGGP